MTRSLCQCGCGLPAPVAQRTSRKDGHVKGQQLRFIRGHQNRNRDRAPRAPGAPMVELEDCGYESKCLVWRGATNSRGYGVRSVDGRRMLAHVAAYEEAYGVVPAGCQVHHQCEVKLCTNPAHLEAVSALEHARRHADGESATAVVERVLGAAGGPMTAQEIDEAAVGVPIESVRVALRRCMDRGTVVRVARAVYQAAGLPVPERPVVAQTHCKRGHEFTPENTRMWRGYRLCRACRREAQAEGMRRKRAA